MNTKPIINTLPAQSRKVIERELANYKIDLTDDAALRHMFIKTRQICLNFLPENIQDELNKVYSSQINPPYMLLKNTPIDDVSTIKTPIDGYLSKDKPTMVSEAFLLGICQLVGIPYSFLLERRNAGLIHLIAGRPGQEFAKTSENWLARLFWHTEHAWSSLLCPSYVVLHCVRQDPDKQAITGLIDVREMMPLLDKQDLAILQKPIFSFSLPDSFGSTQGVTPPISLISGSSPMDNPQFRFTLEEKMHVVSSSSDEEAAGYAAISNLIKLIESREDLVHKITLEPGDLLIINNRTCVHSRSSFTVFDHGFNRWLHRMLVIPSLYEARSMKTPRLQQFA